MTKLTLKSGVAGLLAAVAPSLARASETDIKIPDLNSISFFDGSLSGHMVLMIGLGVCVLGVIYGWLQ
jgi:K(+)-stimulated pyrophosphate-energized sodium pump